MSSRTVYIRTETDGTYTYDRPTTASIRGVAVELDTLTTPDITISDGVYGDLVLELVGLGADTLYAPDTFTTPVVMGSLKVEVTGGGSETHGRVHFLLET